MQKAILAVLVIFSAAFAQPPKEADEPPAELLAWLEEKAVPLKTATPIDNYQDLLPLKEMIGEARVVALGEATHGTSEFFTLKHRVIQFLAEEMDFTIFSIEGDMPESHRVNEYVLTGEGNPRELLRNIHDIWIWNTQEVLDMILWMREYNASGRGVIQFTGFDLQSPTVAMEEVRTFIKAYDAAYLAQLDSTYEVVSGAYTIRSGWDAPTAELEAWRDAARKVLDYLTNNQASYSAAEPSEIAWAVQNARIVLQGAEFKLAQHSSPLRDELMATNIEWILDRNPEAKVVLWAHNAHVKESSQRQKVMGEYLSEKLGNDYVSIGFTFYEGGFQAQPRSGEAPQVHFTPAAPADSIEGAFHSLGLPFFALNLREAGQDERASWLAKPQNARMIIGSLASDYQLSFSSRQLLFEYDALIFVDQMTPTHLLK